MDDSPDLVLFGIAFGFGAVVPAGSLYALTAVYSTSTVGGTLSLVLPSAWIAVIALGAALLGGWLRLPTDALLGGGITGTVVGFWAFATLVGWSFVMFAAAPLAVLAIVAGAWGGYERARRHGDTEEPPYGTWRHVFTVLAVLLLAIPALLLFA
ncbi:hypothetical protein [Natrononativus amylolyticus]|uniref:hypothetical protein n=1 Tax=Natrononativus amylolyticus TaxID=2963434 RepID=UPI0020CB8E20|nr:hypothetical protein [Natrononativus amylolyticus]